MNAVYDKVINICNTYTNSTKMRYNNIKIWKQIS